MFELNGKAALVVGSSYGMGYTIVETIAKQGASVAVVGRDQDKVEKAVATINNSGAKAIGIPTDVRIYKNAQAMVEKAVMELGKIDTLVNVVGGGFRRMFIEYTEEEWDDMITLNLKTMFNCTQAVARQMVKQGNGGSIINISSMVAWVPDHTMSAYAAAKAGIQGLTLTLMQELAPYNIRINSIEPGFIETPGAKDLSPDFEKLRSKRAACTALNRYGKPENIAAAAVFLASDESNFMTGREMRIDGGFGVKLPHFVED